MGAYGSLLSRRKGTSEAETSVSENDDFLLAIDKDKEFRFLEPPHLKGFAKVYDLPLRVRLHCCN